MTPKMCMDITGHANQGFYSLLYYKKQKHKKMMFINAISKLFWKMVNTPKQSPLPLKISKDINSNILPMHTNRVSRQ